MHQERSERRENECQLKERDIEMRKSSCEMMSARQKRKRSLHRAVTDDEKWIYFDNLKRKKS